LIEAGVKNEKNRSRPDGIKAKTDSIGQAGAQGREKII
jgi:hypothetical protein